MIIIKTIKELTKYRRSLNEEVSLVPTMGCLHQGHVSLLELAKDKADFVAVSIFVNPTQFNKKEDLDNYPRTLEADLDLLKNNNVDLAFCPNTEEIYQGNLDTAIKPSKLADSMEGEFRPGHFAGVCTVVNILLNLIRPHYAIFGEKDFQQLRVIEQMVEDLKIPTTIIPAKIFREDHGLAASSRNERLSKNERQEAAVIYKGLIAAKNLVANGTTNTKNILEHVHKVLAENSYLQVEYLTINNPKTLQEQSAAAPTDRIFFAGNLGSVRLIDNLLLN